MAEQWIGKLGALHQYRDVPYILTQDGSYAQTSCALCGTGWMSTAARKAHMQGSFHKLQYERVRALEAEEAERKRKEAEEKRVGSRYLEMKTLEPRVSQLGLESWRSATKRAMFDYAGAWYSRDSVDALLGRYEQKERLSLLELAVWKCRIADGIYFPNIDMVREYPALDEGFDAKEYIRNARICSGSEIIVPGVIRFL